MSQSKLVLLALTAVLFVFTGVIQAQETPRDRGDRRNFDPEQFRQRMVERYKEQLGVSDDEWKVIGAKIEQVMAAQRETRGGGRMFFGGRGRDSSRTPQSAVAKAFQDLRTTLENQNASADDIAKRLAAYRQARESAQAKLQAAQKELRELLTQRQEAVLVMSGLLD